jgi:aflatoxin B1 aldehyde reductase
MKRRARADVLGAILEREYVRRTRYCKGAAKKYQLSEAECALRWIVHHSKLERGRGDAVITGASRLEHLWENLKDLEREPLPDEVAEALDKAWSTTKGVVGNYYH